MKKQLGQKEQVLHYLVKKGTRGATNFEMMIHLHICDVRKRITDINRDPESLYSVVSDFETSKQGVTYKRYWAVPVDYDSDLEGFKNETKCASKSRQAKPAKKRQRSR